MKYAIILALMLGLTQKVEAMSIFDVGKTCVFSEVKARIVRDGEPLKNVKIIRRWEWSTLKEDRTSTDEAGYFEFNAVFETSLSRMLPVELVIAQGLYVVDDNEEIKIWSNSKREPSVNAEFNGKSIDLYCELNNQMQIYRDFGSRMRTLCTWEY